MMNTNNSKLPIKGLGTDIIEIDRIRKSFDMHGYRFLMRLFSVQEQDYCLKYKDPIPHFAARFSVKESIVKALGTGFGKQASWLDMEILNDPGGKPNVIFSENLNKTLNNPLVLVSISHCRLYVSTVAIWVNTDG